MQPCRHGLNRIHHHARPLRVGAAVHVSNGCCFTRHYASESPTTSPPDIAVLGGGITGLATAYYLTQQLPSAKVTIYEASDRLGGWISSKRVPVRDGTVLFEGGPRTLRPLKNGLLACRLLQELDIAKHAIFAHKISPAARNRYLYYPNHLVRMPHPSFGIAENFWSVIREPIFKGVISTALLEVVKDSRGSDIEDESVGTFFSRRFSVDVVERLLSGIIHGIYAGDVWQLSAKSLFPIPWRNEVEEGSVIGGFIKSRSDGQAYPKSEVELTKTMAKFDWDPLLQATMFASTVFTLKDGLGMLTDGLARSLLGSGSVEFKTSTSVESLAPTDDKQGVLVSTRGSAEPNTHRTVISALSPGHLNALTTGTELIPDIPTVTVMTVNLYFRTPDLAPAGFGYLIPLATPFENNPERALGVVFDTAYSPSPADVDTSNWEIDNINELRDARERGQLVNVNDFAWYNMPDKPNIQDEVPVRGTKLTVMLGGHWWDGWPSYPDEQEGLAMAKALLQRHLGIKEEPEAWQVNIQKDCIPQYTVGHEKRLITAHTNLMREYRGRLRVTGNWMSGVGVNDCLRSAWEVVRALREGRDGTGLEHVGSEEYVRVNLGA